MLWFFQGKKKIIVLKKFVPRDISEAPGACISERNLTQGPNSFGLVCLGTREHNTTPDMPWGRHFISINFNTQCGLTEIQRHLFWRCRWIPERGDETELSHPFPHFHLSLCHWTRVPETQKNLPPTRSCHWQENLQGTFPAVSAHVQTRRTLWRALLHVDRWLDEKVNAPVQHL